MSTYTIHQPPLRNDETLPDPERFVFVRDGFYLWAFVFGPAWMLRHRLFVVLLLYLVLLALVAAAIWLAGLNAGVFLIVNYLISLLLGIEAATLRRWTLTRRGWNNLGVVVADDVESAERRFFDAWVAHEGEPVAASPTHASTSVPPMPPRHAAHDIIGLFPEPGARR